MPIVRQGELNQTALVVADVYTTIVSPQVRLLNGVPTDGLAVVGSAPWGAVNRPTIVGSYSQYTQSFGGLRDRKHDAGTVVAMAVRQGAQNFTVVRVTDGTDLRATAVAPAAPASDVGAFYGKFSGSFGNGIRVQILKGARPGIWRAIVTAPGLYPESFNDLPEVGFWAALEAAINLGTDIRGPSSLVTYAHGGATSAPAAAVYALAGGTDGADGVDATKLLGSDGAVRTGVYSLRGSRAAILVVADLDTVEDWPELEAFTKGAGIYGVVAFPSGTSIQDAIDAKQGVGTYDWSVKVLHGDHLIIKDPVFGRLRTVNPAGIVAGRLANLSPEQSSLNKQLYGIVGSERTGLPGSETAAAYSHAELAQLALAGIDVVCNPAPGGSYWACRNGLNASADPNVGGDNYTRMTHYISRTLNAAMGQFIGRVVGDDLLAEVTAVNVTFLSGMQEQKLLRPLLGQACFSVVCNGSNNSAERLAGGYLQCDVQVRYGPIVERFLLNIEAGQGVAIAESDISVNRIAA